MAEAGQRNPAWVLRDARSVQMRWQDADLFDMTNAQNRRPLATLAMVAVLLSGPVSCAQDPAEAEYFTALRGEETGMGRRQQLAHVERAMALQPRRAWYWETHAIYSIDVQDYETAAADLNEAVRLADRPYLRHLRGLVACERGKYESSLEDFDRAIAGQPKNTQFYRGRSLALSKVGRFEDALADARRLVEMVPQQGETWYALGEALTGLGRHGEAIHSYDESLRRRPELIYPLRGRAEAYRRMGDERRAASDLGEAARREREGSTYAAVLDPFRY
jgi:tetratricopeptide (TPR) repeat protein